MKRRAFVRVATGVVSAAAFTSTGWLMGTRTLTKGGAELPAPESSSLSVRHGRTVMDRYP